MPERERPAALPGLQLSPLSLVILSWLGKSDALLVGLYFLHTSILRSRAARFATAALMVLTHQEIATVMLASDAIVQRRVLWPTAAGLLSARAAVYAYQANVEGLLLTRLGLGLAFAERAAVGWAANAIAQVALGVGWTWLLVIGRFQDDRRWTIIACLTLAYAASWVVADFTRVTSLCALPLLVMLARTEAEDPAGRAWLGSVAVAAVCLVQLQIADHGLLHDSSWPEYVLKTVRGMSWW